VPHNPQQLITASDDEADYGREPVCAGPGTGYDRRETVGGRDYDCSAGELLSKPATTSWKGSRVVKRTLIWISLVVVLLLTPLAGCGGDDDEDEKEAKPVEGTFVGEVRGTQAFLAVVAAPPRKGQDRRDVTVYVCDASRLCEWFTGSATGNDFVAKSADDDAEARGRLSGKTATGTIEPRDGETVRYEIGPARATAGLYDLTVSSRGKIRGASAAGVALTGESTLPEPGSGTLKLADGSRLKFDVTRGSAAGLGLRDGQIRLIVLGRDQLRGAGRIAGGEEEGFFLRSSK
jgi:hypothetical protein